ncbi:MAG: YbaB/EbfC family nucleoid-associated protein [Planctomycetota bacterium]|jgi:DNA-binding YbaB/EbfC family protein
MDFMNMMKDLPAMMGRMKDMQEDIKNIQVKGSSGGEMVVVELNGAGEMLNITLEKDIVDPEDIEMLSDLIVAAVADARKNMAAKVQEEMSKYTGGIDLSSLGINLPGMG